MKQKMSAEVALVRQVTFAYNNHPVLEGVDLTIHAGDFAAVIGPNGGGKTTLIKLLLGLLKPQKGSVTLFGETPAKTVHRVGYVPQDAHLHRFFPLTVLELTLMGRLGPGHFYRRYTAEDLKAAEAALDRMEMLPYRKARLDELSGGQRQRVFIARALASQPDALFLDEPAAGVDSAGQTDLYTHLKELNERLTILVVTHDLLVLSSYVKSVVCVNRSLVHHPSPEVTEDILRFGYPCPVELLAHGHVPHRVLPLHGGRNRE
ncbi:metal ABC transporter ATP-binding protein [Desulfosoma caldarium]|uniref:Zinc transport system ATP-binding protein n=1 Tax=Desulfosoma caldarium TaxID=610254 RepID=A0A3N1UMS5_9BACT|nr:metal ABC transporter ATP-binding protein [Desulfosoma caldarium]ROQ90699.1 zinc transport system ATP-binding protein [Desulfosoma caldarium]